MTVFAAHRPKEPDTTVAQGCGTPTDTAAPGRRRLAVCTALAAWLAASCAAEPAEPAGCAGEAAAHPQGRCQARYYQTDFGDKAVTQAMVECAAGAHKRSGEIVSIASLRSGIGLRWIDPQTLEIALAPGEGQRAPASAVYAGQRLRYVYRELRRDEPAWAGCGIAARTR